MTYRYFEELPRPEDFQPSGYTEVLIANSRPDQVRVRVAVDAVFAAHPTLGIVFQPSLDSWTWDWAAVGAGRWNPRESPSHS